MDNFCVPAEVMLFVKDPFTLNAGGETALNGGGCKNPLGTTDRHACSIFKKKHPLFFLIVF